MKFTKYNNPNRKRRRKPAHTPAYVEERRNEMYNLIAQAKTEAERDNIIKAYHATIRP